MKVDHSDSVLSSENSETRRFNYYHLHWESPVKWLTQRPAQQQTGLQDSLVFYLAPYICQMVHSMLLVDPTIVHEEQSRLIFTKVKFG